jgi:hypothetical protein
MLDPLAAAPNPGPSPDLSAHFSRKASRFCSRLLNGQLDIISEFYEMWHFVKKD